GKIFLGGVATSIDALAVGVAESMENTAWDGFLPLHISVFVVTALTAILGICGGRFIGSRVGRIAEIIGGCVLIAIGSSLLF
ncbi:MAG: manganese efflux pump, partial [Bacteroidales bacterium]|nr:manganese efflux pump [Bacteroidales bacterium]